jgi:hypothetical protein
VFKTRNVGSKNPMLGLLQLREASSDRSIDTFSPSDPSSERSASGSERFVLQAQSSLAVPLPTVRSCSGTLSTARSEDAVQSSDFGIGGRSARSCGPSTGCRDRTIALRLAEASSTRLVDAQAAARENPLWPV